METYISHSPGETADIGEKIAKGLKKGDCVLFSGEMGAGKTHFTKGIARAFGADESDVTSPTFALVNEYYGEIPVFHFDMFRISGLDDLYAIGFFDYLDRGGITVIEWSENIPGLESYVGRCIKVDIKKLSDTEREITVGEASS